MNCYFFFFFVKLKKQNVVHVCAHDFFWFATKVIRTTTFDFLVILSLILGTIFSEIGFLANLKWQTFLHFLIKITLKVLIIFIKLKKQNVVYAHAFS